MTPPSTPVVTIPTTPLVGVRQPERDRGDDDEHPGRQPTGERGDDGEEEPAVQPLLADAGGHPDQR